MRTTFFFLLAVAASSCSAPVENDSGSALNSSSSSSNSLETKNADQPKIEILNIEGTTIEDRFNCPEGFERVPTDKKSFEEFLRTLPLKADGSEVKYFDGTTKPNYDSYAAVINMEIGNRDLQQCADAIMRLRAEYLWQNEKYDSIHFNFMNGFKADYSTWRAGHRIVVEGTNSYWTKTDKESRDYASFWEYLEMVFSYAGTISLEKELTQVDLENLKIGDVFIYGGSPGHSIIVVDVAVHQETGEKAFITAQSFMPAQDIHVLNNWNNRSISPWYLLTKEGKIKSPDWMFSRDELKRF